MEDYILREIDRIGELLLIAARRLGLFKDDVRDYSLADVQSEFKKAELKLDLDQIMAQDFPVLYLVGHENLSERGIETLTDILFHSDLDESRKAALLSDAITYLDGKGYYSFRLHSLESGR